MFSIGDKVVYPIHGAGIIVDVETKEVLGETHEYYILQLPINHMRVMVPVASAEEVGVRDILEPSEMDVVFEVLKQASEPMPKNWSRRYRFNLERIKSGDIREIAKVIKDLEHLDAKKTLSTGERKLLNNARQIIISEMVLVYDKDIDEVSASLERAIFPD